MSHHTWFGLVCVIFNYDDWTARQWWSIWVAWNPVQTGFLTLQLDLISNVTQSLPVGLLQRLPVLTLQNLHLTKRKIWFKCKKCGESWNWMWRFNLSTSSVRVDYQMYIKARIWWPKYVSLYRKRTSHHTIYLFHISKMFCMSECEGLGWVSNKIQQKCFHKYCEWKILVDT